ncbi:MAG TPA: branched-chain amino acid ABC transporter permease, partial [Candidatus Methylomirabilis sp.]|nr:branched-chain amino acid ABC transporter permease [Candidatus Methylomirabilis sp.]
MGAGGRGSWVLAAAGVGVLVALPLVLNAYVSSYLVILLSQSLISGILAMSLNLLLGYAGLPSLGHAAYLGVAAYAAAILATRYEVGFWPALGVGVLLACVAAAAFGLIAIRARGVYFLMITLALAMVVWGLAYRWVSVTAGDNGIPGIQRPLLGLPWSLRDPVPWFYFCLVFFLAATGIMALLVRSPFGRSLVGIRESESRMRVLGYNVWLHLYLAFVLAGTLGGVAGVLWAYYNGFVSPVDVELVTSVEVLLMVALGGPGTLLGPALGALIIV